VTGKDVVFVLSLLLLVAAVGALAYAFYCLGRGYMRRQREWGWGRTRTLQEAWEVAELTPQERHYARRFWRSVLAFLVLAAAAVGASAAAR